MAALNDILVYLVYVFFGLYLLAMLLRFLLQLVRADFYNPISQALVKLTNPLVIPLRKLIPGYAGIDLSSLLLAILLQMLMAALLVLLQTGAVLAPLPLVLVGLLGVAAYLVQVYFFAILAMIILMMAPFRKVIPPMGGLDLSPILVFIVINVIQIALGHLAYSLGIGGLVPWL
jgi:YggT family protein